MMQKLIKCAIIGGVVLFIWGMISWTVLPWHKVTMHRFQNEERVASAIRDNAEVSGVYVMPNLMNLPKGSEELRSAEQQMREGPFMFASIVLEGKNPDMSLSILKSFILKVVLAFIATWLLLRAKQMPYNKQVGFITMVGLVIGLSTTMTHMIWFGFPLGFSLACLFEIVFGWFFAGLVIAKMAK
jgi:hypothetical protein